MHPDLISLLIKNMADEFRRERHRQENPFVEGQTPSGHYVVRTRFLPPTKNTAGVYTTAVYDRCAVNTRDTTPHPPLFFVKSTTIEDAVTNHYVILNEYERLDKKYPRTDGPTTLLNQDRSVA